MLAVVVRPNPYFRVGTWLDGDDDGWRKAEVKTVENRLRVVKTTGVIIPQSRMKPYIMRPKKKGLDK